MAKKLTYGPKFRGFGMAAVVPKFPSSNIYGDYARVQEKGPNTSISASQKVSEKARRRAAEQPILVKQVPSKKDIREYCRQDARFRHLDDFISEAVRSGNQKGVSAANTERSNIRARLLRELPYGPILN